MSCKRTVAAREEFPKYAGDLKRDLQSLGLLGSRLHTMPRAVSDTQQSWLRAARPGQDGMGQDKQRMTGDPYAHCA